MTHLFGTDGMRGRANIYPMTAEIVMRLAMAMGLEFKNGSHRHTVVIGKDTRLSGYLFEQALTAGFISVGVDVWLVGPIPTPAVAMLTKSMRADFGIMISASHNPYDDNGIKIFKRDGYKLSDEVQHNIEKKIEEDLTPYLVQGDQLGKAFRIEDSKGRYIQHLKQAVPPGVTLEGLKIVLDCAHGAAYQVAPKLLWEFGAEVVTIGASPNGTNINDAVGATNPQALSKRVLKEKADMGIALDGDADRLVIVDEKGEIIDGDQLIALIAFIMQEKGAFDDSPKIVSTIMSNAGLAPYLRTLGLELLRANVGDRYVLEVMKESSALLGAEPSGHIILGSTATTGDGLKAALEILIYIQKKKQKISSFFPVFKLCPQKLSNIKYDLKLRYKDLLAINVVQKHIEDATSRVGKEGRVLVRQSGTEPMMRVMVESEDRNLLDSISKDLSLALDETLQSLAKVS